MTLFTATHEVSCGSSPCWTSIGKVFSKIPPVLRIHFSKLSQTTKQEFCWFFFCWVSFFSGFWVFLAKKKFFVVSLLANIFLFHFLKKFWRCVGLGDIRQRDAGGIRKHNERPAHGWKSTIVSGPHPTRQMYFLVCRTKLMDRIVDMITRLRWFDSY